MKTEAEYWEHYHEKDTGSLERECDRLRTINAELIATLKEIKRDTDCNANHRYSWQLCQEYLKSCR